MIKYKVADWNIFLIELIMNLLNYQVDILASIKIKLFNVKLSQVNVTWIHLKIISSKTTANL